MATKQEDNNNKKGKKGKKKLSRPTMPKWLWYMILLSSILVFFFAQFFIIRWGVNTLYVLEAKRGVYHPVIESMLRVINIPDRYVVWYNIGNYHFQKGDYKKAEEDYYRALKGIVPYEKECPIKINLALATINQLTDDEWDAFLNAESSEDMDAKGRVVEKTLITARSLLIEDGCAHEDDEEGHSEQAQILKDEIDELLKKNGSQGDNDDNQDDNDQSQDENDKNNNQNDNGGGGSGNQDQREDQIQNHLQDKKEEAQKERSEDQQYLQNENGYGQDDQNQNKPDQGGDDPDSGGNEDGDGDGGDGGSDDEDDGKIW